MAALHATAVAIAGEALVIRGPSRSGKSRLAVALIARSTRGCRIVLVGDDRILLRRRADVMIAAPHPRIAGFMERRGLGIVAMPWVDGVPVRGCVDLGAAPPEAPLANLPRLQITAFDGAAEAAARVLAWWARGRASCARHAPAKTATAMRSRAKD